MDLIKRIKIYNAVQKYSSRPTLTLGKLMPHVDVKTFRIQNLPEIKVEAELTLHNAPLCLTGKQKIYFLKIKQGNQTSTYDGWFAKLIFNACQKKYKAEKQK